MQAAHLSLCLFVVVAAACGGPAPPTLTAPGPEPNEDFCAGEDALRINERQSAATYLCSLEGFDVKSGWARIDTQYQEPQPNSVQWLTYVLGLSINIRTVPRDTPLDVTTRPDLVRDLHLTTVNALGDTSRVASYSRTVTFAGSMIVGTGAAPMLTVCIASEVGVAGSTRRAQVWMRAAAICR